MKLYKELAEYYFAIEANHRNIIYDIHLIGTHLKKYSEPSVLDLGCGTGEHLNAVKQFGVKKCVGVDNSPEMLEVARERFPEGIKFLNMNFRSFDFYQEFDLIMSLFGSIAYITNERDVDTFFWNTWRALKPGGTGIFEIWNSVPVKKIRSKPLSHVSKTTYHDAIIERERGFELIDEAKSISEVTYRYRVYSRKGSLTYNDTHTMRAFTLDEVKKFISDNGMILKEVYANSKKEPFNENSNKMLIIFEKEV
ncbi:MAG TPA: class I SAM-dependent methyltransferase [Spirochaetota bacterium]|nr:class I SAM-dependent methyltransferase [Spirochaetota bacterium]HPF05013.1 class I SAM-dependent methyltransferase [Spirochaetota bacterium]HPJ41210.1 class I SAM-dependent methyltransferase [Spirochaetota bacterium]HPR37936.1 class I SAM-dependent methyltransferase [Spirochaetota bacterium]HRX48476.1 class I SAM-dependent methyltransferase [Spirochaetota bacterium]